MEALIISTHVYNSRRRASLHWIADSLSDEGYNVSFLTTGLSLISKIKGDYRLQEINRKSSYTKNVKSYPIISIYHPVNLRNGFLNAAAWPLWAKYPNQFKKIIKTVKYPDVIIIESGSSVALTDIVRSAFPQSIIIYRVSDILETMSVHPILQKMENDSLSKIDMVSVPSPKMVSKFSKHNNVVIHPHGVQLEILNNTTGESPFSKGTKNIVCVGTMLLDAQALTIAAKNHPSVNFHVFGKANLNPLANLQIYGEVPFADTLPYIKHCDAGIAPYKRSPSAEYLADTSNKIMQFNYFKKAIIAPEFVCTSDNMFPYNSSDENSIVNSVTKSLDPGNLSSKYPRYQSWKSVVKTMIKDAELKDLSRR